MPKDTVKSDPFEKDDRVLYALGFEDLALADEPALILSRKQIIESAEAKGWPLPVRVSKKGNEKVDFDFRPSDLAVHPKTGNYYILSGPDRTLLAVTPKGELRGTAVFPPETLAQPEGLAFFPNGDLLISSEGTRAKKGEQPDATAVILRFPNLPR